MALLELKANESSQPVEVRLGAPPLFGVVVHSGINHPRNQRVALQVESNRAGISAVFAHAQRECLQPLQKLKSVEGAQGHAQVAQQYDSRPDDVSDRSQRLHGLSPHRAVVARIRLVEGGETVFVRLPIEVATIDDDAPDRSAMTANVFGQRVHYDGCTVV